MEFADKIYSDDANRNQALSVILIIVFGTLCMIIFVLIAGLLETDSQIFSFLAYGTIPVTIIALIYIVIKDPHEVSKNNSHSTIAPTEELDPLSELREKYAQGEINEEELEHRTEQELKNIGEFDHITEEDNSPEEIEEDA